MKKFPAGPAPNIITFLDIKYTGPVSCGIVEPERLELLREAARK